MTRDDVERKIVAKLMEIEGIYKQYNPEGNFLSMCIGHRTISAYNSYYGKDKEKPVNIMCKKEG